MQKWKRQSPSYRQRKGYDQAIVTLTDGVTSYRKDYRLGPYGSPENRELYHRVLAQWESGGRRLPVTLDDRPADIAQVSVTEVLNAYWKWAGVSDPTPAFQPPTRAPEHLAGPAHPQARPSARPRPPFALTRRH